MHIPVLKDETIDGLEIKAGDIVLDGTLGGGGHTAEIIRRFGSAVKMICLDLDADAIERTKARLSDTDHDIVYRTIGFQEMDSVLGSLNIPMVDRILLDLGLSNFQLEESGRGFSFKKDEPLLMTMKKNLTKDDLTAKEIVNEWGEETLADIFYGFGEEKHSRKIAKDIVEARKKSPIKTTFDLVKIVEESIGRFYKAKRIHPATKIFQALRIATNSELTNLEEVVEKGFNRLSVSGRMAIISFHSLEDRIVKRAFNQIKKNGYAKIITKKPIIPTNLEINNNPKSRSAKLRIIEKI